MLAQLKLRSSGSARLFDRHARWRMRPGPRRRVPRAGTDLDDIRDPVPLAIKLADLLLIHLERQRDLMIVLGRFSVHDRKIERAARSRVQDAHQRSLRIAIANMKGLHSLSPYCVGSSSNNISERAAPAGTIGKTLASGAQSNTSNSGSGDRRNRSI